MHAFFPHTLFSMSAPFPNSAPKRSTFSWPRCFSLDAPNLVPLVLLLLCAHLLLWTVLPALSHRAPDWDNMEELVWASSLEWGYYKHPPLPSWLMVGLISIFGRPVWLTFFAGQLSVVLSLWFIWRLGSEITTQKRALVLVLLLSTIAYCTVRGVMNNHNTIQLWSIAGALWMFYRALRRDSLLAWFMLGLFGALALLTKYSALVQFASFFLFLLVSGKLRQARTWQGIALATGVLLVCMTPHVLWLIHQAAGPLGYASESLAPKTSRLEHLHVIYDFILTNIGRIAPMGLALLILVISIRKTASTPTRPTLAQEFSNWDKRFLLIVGLGPFLLTLAASIALKTPLAAHWATTFFLLFGFFTCWVLRSNDDTQLLRKTLWIIAILQIIMATGYALARGPLSDLTGRATRATFPGAQVSAALQATWKAHVPHPLKLVAADTWLGGNIATHANRDVAVLINGDVSKSPWVNPAKVAPCGLLLAINRSPENDSDGVPPKVVELMSQAVWTGTVRLPWTSKINGPEVVVDWGIIPPQGRCGGD